MNLDFITLTMAGGLVAFVSALLLLFASLQFDRGSAALRLGLSHLAAAGAIILLALSAGQDPALPLFAQPAFVVAAFLALSATLSFERKERPVALIAAAGGALVFLVAMIIARADGGLVRLVQLGFVGPLYLSAAAVLWISRAGRLRARLPLAAIFLLHGAVSLIGLAEGILHEAIPRGVPTFGNWYGVIHVESMIYFIGSTLFLVALLKEQSELVHRNASLTDPLTGLANRRAFFNEGDRLLERCRRSKSPCSVVALDLDRFKSINDTFGHSTGDRVLEVFAAVVARQLRPADLVGRLGGEEFGVVLPRTHVREAGEIGDRIRTAFSDAAFSVDGRDVAATLSAGVAVAFGDERTIAEVLERADAALYRAKLNGRDRVELDTLGNTIRVVGRAS